MKDEISSQKCSAFFTYSCVDPETYCTSVPNCNKTIYELKLKKLLDELNLWYIVNVDFNIEFCDKGLNALNFFSFFETYASIMFSPE